MENKLFDLAAAHRSFRKYTGDPIDPQILDEIMKVALTPPASLVTGRSSSSSYRIRKT